MAENTYDLGEYFWKLHSEGRFDTNLGPVSLRAVYYPPCHLRGQRIGRPYNNLLRLIPRMSTDMIDEIFCCGNGGVMGFKKTFHLSSIKIGSSLLARIKSSKPEVLVTDCVSRRMQFNQLTSYKVLHPIQLIKESYGHYEEARQKKAV